MAHVIQFSEAAFIALHGMVIVAQAKNNELVNVVHISDRLNSSKHHVAKVMQRLVKDGFLNSHRGPSEDLRLRFLLKKFHYLHFMNPSKGKLI